MNNDIFGKKGFAIQFNWLFVLIGGVIILGFFFSVITNQASEEEQRSAQKSTQELNDLLKVSLASRDTQKNLLFEKKIMFYCDGISEFYVEGASKHSRYDHNVIFSPNQLEGRELIIQTLVFETPFRTAPFVYVTNKDVEHVFVGSSPLINLVYNLMPDNTTKKAIPAGSLASYPNNNYDHTVFVLPDESYLSKLSYFDNDEVFAVVIKSAEAGVIDYGELSFYYYDPGSGFVKQESIPFLGAKSILGGVISHNSTIYECNLRKALQRIVLLSQMHEQRMSYYAAAADDFCQANYPIASQHLEDIKTYAEKKDLLLNDFKNLVIAINGLRSLNNYILTKTNCPLIY